MCLCLNILEHSALAMGVLLSTHLTAGLVPLSEHEKSLRREYVLYKIFMWQAGRSRTVINNGDVVNFTPKSY